jgi:uncharacterized protein (DUF2147 family)
MMMIYRSCGDGWWKEVAQDTANGEFYTAEIELSTSFTAEVVKCQERRPL